jgi:hypothetical protein
MSKAEDLTPISDRLDMAIDLAIDYAVATLAAGERLQPAASYESAGEVARAFFLGLGNPDPVVEAREWVAALSDVAYAVISYPGEVHYKTSAARQAVLAEAWEAGMAKTVVIAQEYEVVEGGDPEQGVPMVRPTGNQLEVGTTVPLWAGDPTVPPDARAG